MTTTYPVRYGTRRETAEYIESKLRDEEYHPEFVERFMAWMIAQGGLLGPGGTRREHGNQPDRPGFAPEGRSFHQPQRYADDWYGPTAIDLVVGVPGDIHRAPKWSEVPEQGSDEARRWGVHCNISTETWHIQPIEIDGYGTWKNQGSPAPVPDYPFPGRHPVEPPDPIDPPEEHDMGQLNYIRLRIRTKDGKLTNQQVMGLAVANLEAERELGVSDDPMFTATVDATEAQIREQLGVDSLY